MFSFRLQGLLYKKLKTLKRAVFEKEFHFSFTQSFWSILFLYQFIDCFFWTAKKYRAGFHKDIPKFDHPYLSIWSPFSVYWRYCSTESGSEIYQYLQIPVKPLICSHPLRRGHKFPMVLTTSYPLTSQLKIEICFVFLFQITSKVVSLQRIVHRFLEAHI